MNQPFHKRKERLNLFQTLFGKKKNIKVTTSEMNIEMCPKCSTAIESQTLKQQNYVCLQCNHHFPMGAYDRIDAHFDADSFIEIYAKANSNHLNSFPDYLNKLRCYSTYKDLILDRRLTLSLSNRIMDLTHEEPYAKQRHSRII